MQSPFAYQCLIPDLVNDQSLERSDCYSMMFYMSPPIVEKAIASNVKNSTVKNKVTFLWALQS